MKRKESKLLGSTRTFGMCLIPRSINASVDC